MMFKKSKNDVAFEARMTAENTFRFMLQSYWPHSGTTDSYTMINAITMAMSSAMGDAIQSVVDNIYTDEDFEKDMDLIPKS